MLSLQYSTLLAAASICLLGGPADRRSRHGPASHYHAYLKVGMREGGRLS